MPTFSEQLVLARNAINTVLRPGRADRGVRTADSNPMIQAVVDLIEIHSNDETQHTVSKLFVSKNFANSNRYGGSLSEGYVNTTGTFTIQTGYYHTDYIQVTEGETLFANFDAGATPKIAAYDESKILISFVNSNTRTITAPANARYIVFSVLVSSLPANPYIGTDALFTDKNYNPIKGYNTELINTLETLDNFTVSKIVNLFDKSQIALGYYLSGGSLVADAGYYTSDYIAVNELKTYISNQDFSFRSFFNASKTHISTVSLAGQRLINVPSGAAYVRISAPISTSHYDDEMIEIGSLSSDYRAYGDPLYIDKYALKSEFDLLGLTVSVSDKLGDSTSNPASVFATPDYSGIITTKNSACVKSGIIDTLEIKVSAQGIVRIMVGLLDQRNIMVKSTEFTVNVVAGINTLDIRYLNVQISSGEQIFAQISYDGNAVINWTNNAAANDHSFMYGTENGALIELGTTYGGSVLLNYKVAEINSLFAQQSDVDLLETNMATMQTRLNTMGLVYDRSGNPYKQLVVDGVIELISMVYTKVLALGNSLTIHGLNAGIGYYGENWPMCASTEETGWVKQFERIIQQKEPTGEVIPASIYAWEIDFLNCDLSALLDPLLTSDLDCVIFRAGENGSNTIDYEAGVDRLIAYILDFKPNIDIIMCSLFWHNTIKENAIVNVANKYGLTYIYTGDVGANKCRMGDYTLGSDENYHPIINGGVAAHTNDVGFLQFANLLASTLGYSAIPDLYNITVNDPISKGYICFPTWVAGGVFNIQTSATTVTANGGAITVTDRGGGVFTFTMPSSDVTINIS